MKIPIIYLITQIPEGLFIRYVPVNSATHAQEIFDKDGYTQGWALRRRDKTWCLVVPKEEYDYIMAEK